MPNLLSFAKPSNWTKTFLSTTVTAVPIILQPCLQHVQFATPAICNMFNLQHLQFAIHSICNTCNLQHMQFATCAIWRIPPSRLWKWRGPYLVCRVVPHLRRERGWVSCHSSSSLKGGCSSSGEVLENTKDSIGLNLIEVEVDIDEV